MGHIYFANSVLVRFDITSAILLVWCDMSEICLKLKVLAKIDFIVFLTLSGVK